MKIHAIRGAWWLCGRVSNRGAKELGLKQTVAMQHPWAILFYTTEENIAKAPISLECDHRRLVRE